MPTPSIRRSSPDEFMNRSNHVEYRLGARVVKLVDTGDLKSPDPDTVVPVRFRSRAPRIINR
jgi:hypothetical protein